jgi:hypothetical protein
MIAWFGVLTSLPFFSWWSQNGHHKLPQAYVRAGSPWGVEGGRPWDENVSPCPRGPLSTREGHLLKKAPRLPLLKLVLNLSLSERKWLIIIGLDHFFCTLGVWGNTVSLTALTSSQQVLNPEPSHPGYTWSIQSPGFLSTEVQTKTWEKDWMGASSIVWVSWN